MSKRRQNFVLKRNLGCAIASICAGVTISHQSFSQEAEDGAIQEIITTGSRIQGATNVTAPQPVSVVDTEQLANTSVTDISDILNDNPAMLASETSSSTSDTGNIGSADNVGGSALNLRGLGSQRTLVVVNGRRHVSGIEGTSSVDVSTIPQAMIERVEVLTGGASAVYGADAVTGVVNFVLKDNYEGIEIDARPGISDQGDAESFSASVVMGQNFNQQRGNVTFALQHQQMGGLRKGDRAFTANDGTFDDDVNPAFRFQQGDIDASATPNLSRYYNFDNTGLFPWGLGIPDPESFASNYEAEFGESPQLSQQEQALFDRAANATPRALAAGRTFNITSPYGVVSIGDFGSGKTPLGSEPDLDGNGTPDCLQSFTGYNSSLGGAQSFGAVGGCWYINEGGQLVPYQDGLVAGNFNQFGAEQSFIAPNRPYTIPEDEKYAVNLNASYDFSRGLELFAESKYVYHEVQFGGDAHMATDLLYGAPDNPFLPDALQAAAQNDGVGFVGPGGLYISRDSDDWGDNVSTNERQTFRVVAGARGTFDLLETTMDYELSANYGRFERDLIDREEVIIDRWFASIDAVQDPATGNTVCRSDLDSTAYPETTPFNFPSYLGGGVPSPFFTFSPGDGQCQPANIWGGRGSISQDAIDFFTRDRTVEEDITQKVINGFVSGSTDGLFRIPTGGPLSFAAGAEWREEQSGQRFDQFDRGVIQVSGQTPDGQSFQPGDQVGSVSEAAALGANPDTRLSNSSSSFDVWDIFAEFEAPIMLSQPFAEELVWSGSIRRADYSTSGSNVTWGSGLVWSPVNDLRLRVNHSEAVRVPNLFELFSPEQGQGFRPNDPCDTSQISSAPNPEQRQANCVAHLQQFNVTESNIFDSQGNYAFADPLSAGFSGVVGGNPDLNPEEATTQTAGFVLQPRWVEGLTLTMDFWDIEIEQAISEISAQNIVDSCYDEATLNNPFCGLFERNPSASSAQSGGFTFLRQTLLNFGSAEASGVDLQASYEFNFRDLMVGLNGAVTKQQKLRFIQPANAGEEPTIDFALGELRRPEWSGQFSARVSRGSLDLTWRTQYLGEQALSGDIETAERNFGPGVFTDDFYNHDLSGSYQYSPGLRIYGGIGNVFDESPYVTSSSFPVTPVGRSYYLGFNYQL